MKVTHKSVKAGAAVAATIATMFAAGAMVMPSVAHAGEGVKCMGVNSCKGTSECATATSQCKGQNGCKGQGWEYKKSAEECEAAGGKVEMKK